MTSTIGIPVVALCLLVWRYARADEAGTPDPMRVAGASPSKP